MTRLNVSFTKFSVLKFDFLVEQVSDVMKRLKKGKFYMRMKMRPFYYTTALAG